jgi:hypothetical protein
VKNSLGIHQKLNVRETCIKRGGIALMACPKVRPLMFPSIELAPKNWGWLSRQVKQLSERQVYLHSA